MGVKLVSNRISGVFQGKDVFSLRRRKNGQKIIFLAKIFEFCPSTPLDIRMDFSDLGGFDLKTLSGEHFRGEKLFVLFRFFPVMFCVSGVVPLGMVVTKKN